ncbi:MAG: thioredoxin family protein [Ignavibacteriales bacterium]|nr:thioredoxin family protein [Ignavibacteriales bacterium]
MTQIIIQRILLSSEIFLAFILVVKSFGAYSEWKLRLRSRKQQLSMNIEKDKPVLLYFWTSDCSQCKLQERQIERAQAVLHQSGKTLEVQKLNAFEEQALAKHMNVMTVPTIVLLNSQGNVTTWNPGLTYADTIIKQYLAIQ